MDKYRNHESADPRDCEHGVDAWTLCDTCLADMLDGNAVLGRFTLVGIAAGLAVDIRSDGRVVVYMLNADLAAFGGGGLSDAWVTHDDECTGMPDVVLDDPTEPVVIAAEEIARTCQVVSDLATALLPFVEFAFASGADGAEVIAELVGWMERLELKPGTQRMFWGALRVVTRAVAALEERQ
ncbi:hypothetical protein [Cryobacterium sp. BB307]|uniref:hypothetical protein n=1 Tax=Cryobacterium sp. BB307 TaxID=2716317 RepID=UPI001446FA79|nr:hypothetical protein [Cryobacterium sp. BB307]